MLNPVTKKKIIVKLIKVSKVLTYIRLLLIRF